MAAAVANSPALEADLRAHLAAIIKAAREQVPEKPSPEDELLQKVAGPNRLAIDLKKVLGKPIEDLIKTITPAKGRVKVAVNSLEGRATLTGGIHIKGS